MNSKEENNYLINLDENKTKCYKEYTQLFESFINILDKNEHLISSKKIGYFKNNIIKFDNLNHFFIIDYKPLLIDKKFNIQEIYNEEIENSKFYELFYNMSNKTKKE